jgi:hypothetical protein
MDFSFTSAIAYPVELVYVTMRDRLPEAAAFMPAVDEIVERERSTDAAGHTRLLNEWQGNPSLAPKVARPFVTRKLVRWRDDAVWDDAARRVDWVFATDRFQSLFDCSGNNTFYDAGDGTTRLVVEGSLVVYPERVPGVPKLIGRRIAPAVTKTIIGLVTPNLEALGPATEALLDLGRAAL